MASSYIKEERNKNLYYWLYYIIFGPIKVFTEIIRFVIRLDDFCDCDGGDIADIAKDVGEDVIVDKITGEEKKTKKSDDCCCSSLCCCCCECL